MKRISIMIIAVALCLMLVVTAGCHADVPVGSEGSATLILTTEGDKLDTYTVLIEDLEQATAISLLDYLAENKGLHLVYQDSDWGAYITEVGSLVAGDNTFINTYTSVQSQWDSGAFFSTTTVLDIEVGTSGVGASELILTDGCVIYMTLASF